MARCGKDKRETMITFSVSGIIKPENVMVEEIDHIIDLFEKCMMGKLNPELHCRHDINGTGYYALTVKKG
jgi:hypothetical protein